MAHIARGNYLFLLKVGNSGRYKQKSGRWFSIYHTMLSIYLQCLVVDMVDVVDVFEIYNLTYLNITFRVVPSDRQTKQTSSGNPYTRLVPAERRSVRSSVPEAEMKWYIISNNKQICPFLFPYFQYCYIFVPKI